MKRRSSTCTSLGRRRLTLPHSSESIGPRFRERSNVLVYRSEESDQLRSRSRRCAGYETLGRPSPRLPRKSTSRLRQCGATPVAMDQTTSPERTRALAVMTKPIEHRARTTTIERRRDVRLRRHCKRRPTALGAAATERISILASQVEILDERADRDVGRRRRHQEGSRCVLA